MEKAWLIERADKDHPDCLSGACMGESSCGVGPIWTTPDFAYRFARKKDAVAIANLIAPGKAVIVNEHSWE
jgi:hypothetical protein